jgi:hypothetical protein
MNPMDANAFTVQFTKGAGGGSLVFMAGKDRYPLFIPRNRDDEDWDLTGTIYPELTEILVNLEKETEIFSNIHIFYNKPIDRYIVLHHASSRCKERYVQTLHLEENNRQERLKYSFTFYITPKFLREYRTALKELHAFLTSEMAFETPPTLPPASPQSILVRDITPKVKKVASPVGPPAFLESFFPPMTSPAISPYGVPGLTYGVGAGAGNSSLFQAFLQRKSPELRMEEEEEEEPLEFEPSLFGEEEEEEVENLSEFGFDESEFEVVDPFSD